MLILSANRESLFVLDICQLLEVIRIDSDFARVIFVDILIGKFGYFCARNYRNKVGCGTYFVRINSFLRILPNRVQFGFSIFIFSEKSFSPQVEIKATRSRQTNMTLFYSVIVVLLERKTGLSPPPPPVMYY